MALATGTRLGSYDIIAPLGAGGMGEVYRAHDVRLARDVAIKVLPDDVASSPDRLARFEREARTVAGLNHPNIVVLHSIEEDAGVRFITMELVEGRSLATLVTPGGMSLAQVLDLAIPLADAVVAAHEKGVVHRDLKPANVMVTRDGRVKVLDFGLAKLTRPEVESPGGRVSDMESQLTMPGEMVGTAPYMAPEQIVGDAADARTDLFAFGILVYELATGRRPFGGQTSWELSSAIIRDDPPSLTSIRSDLPIALERILARCLEKRPHERFQTALDVANELRDLRRSLQHGPAPAPRPAAETAASIAVLPFVNRSASADDEYFSDGLADEMLNVLAKIRGLRVAARTSAFHFKGKDATIAEIGRVLNVATVLEGSVRKSGTRVRISVQLVKVSDGYHLWSETYDRDLNDIFAVQDDIARSVVKELRTALLGAEQDSTASGEVRAEVARAVRGRGTNAEAHRLYAQARHHIERQTPADITQAIGYLEQALRLDPQFALGWAELGRAYTIEANMASSTVGFTRARAMMEKALALEPDLAEGHANLGWVVMLHEWNWSEAEASLRRALELAPGSAVVLRRVAALEANQGRIESAIGFIQRAVEQDPLSAVAHQNLGLVLYAADRFAEAEAAFRKAAELATGIARSRLALALLAQNRGEEALAVANTEPREEFRLYSLAIIQHAVGNRAASERDLQELVEKYADPNACQIAQVHAMRGEPDLAFEWLERSYELKDAGLAEMRSDPTFRPIHGDPRWAAMLRKVGFVD